MLTRRNVIVTILLSLIPSWIFAQQGKLQSFRFRIKTKNKSIINTTIQARDYNEALVKIQKRYPNSIVLNYYPK